MPIDFSQYIDLTPFDAQPGDIYVDAIETARLTLPEFNLRVGTPEDAMFQAMAYISALNISAINRLPDRLMEGILNMMGVSRQDAVSAEVDVTITMDSYAGGVVPAGTIFSYSTIFEDEVQEFAFQTLDTVIVPEILDPEEGDDLPSASVTVVCMNPGIIPPISTPGTSLDVLSSGTNILSVETLANFANGLNPDTDGDYLARATTYLRSLTSAIAKSNQLDSYVLTNYPESVGRAKSYDLTYGDEDLGDVTVNRTAEIITTFLNTNLATVETSGNHLFVVGDVVNIADCGASFNGDRTVTATSDTTFSFVSVASNSGSTSVTGTAEAGADQSGYVTLFAYGTNTFLTEAEKEEILLDISAKSVAGLTFAVRDPNLLTMSVSGSVTVDQAYDQNLLRANIKETLISYLSPANFPYTEDRVRKTKLIALVANIPGVIYVEELNIAGTGDGWLPQFGDDILFLEKGSLPVLAEEDISLGFTLSEI